MRCMMGFKVYRGIGYVQPNKALAVLQWRSCSGCKSLKFSAGWRRAGLRVGGWEEGSVGELGRRNQRSGGSGFYKWRVGGWGRGLWVVVGKWGGEE
ncbi:unnamed protein product [Prunus armeniaca]